MWINRKNMHFRGTAWATHTKLRILLLSLGNSSVVAEDQARGLGTGASPEQASRQRPHPHLKAALAIQSEAQKLPVSQQRRQAEYEQAAQACLGMC